jgi:hypothetical protein
MLHADLKHWEIFKQSKRMDDEQLRTRSAEKRALLKSMEPKRLLEDIELSHEWWAQSLATLALRQVELQGDLRWIEAHGPACESTENHGARQSRLQERFEDSEKVAGMAEMRIELKLMDTIVAERIKGIHIRCTECRVYKNPNDFRREKERIARTMRCFECEFPHCESCESQRSTSDGPCARKREALVLDPDIPQNPDPGAQTHRKISAQRLKPQKPRTLL